MKITRDQWIEAALALLAQEGHIALSAERLSRKVGVTRGSFYHHFASMDELVDAVLQRWKGAHNDIIWANPIRDDALAELQRLLQYTFNIPMDLEIAIRAWAGANPRVAEIVAEVETRRLTSLIQVYQAISGDKETGRRLGSIGYYGLLGAVHATPRLNHEQLRALILDVHEFMMAILQRPS